MARTVLDSQLNCRTARARLQTRVKPYFRAIDPGLHLAYRRNTTGGTWSVRLYLGGGKYQMALLGTADDLGDADGTTVLNFSQAQAAARTRYAQATRAANGLPEPSAGPYTVDQALDDYFTWLEGEGRGERNIADGRAKSKTHHIRPKLGHLRLDRISGQANWRLAARARQVAAAPAQQGRPGGRVIAMSI